MLIAELNRAHTTRTQFWAPGGFESEVRVKISKSQSKHF